MTIYVDSLFVLNFLINYLLLLGSARLSGAEIRRLRLALAAALGGGYAVATVVPGLEVFTATGVKGLVLVLMTLCAFGCRKEAIKQGLLLLGLSFAFCGVAMAVVLAMGKGLMLIHGVAYYPVSAEALILTGAGVYLVAWFVWERLAEHHGGELVPVRLQLGDKAVSLRALQDTGNTLKDPITNQKVMVAEWTVLRDLLPGPAQPLVTAKTVEQPAQLLQSLAMQVPGIKCRLIPFRSVGVYSGLLLAIKCDQMQVGKKVSHAPLVAFSPTPVSDSGNYLALTGGV